MLANQPFGDGSTWPAPVSSSADLDGFALPKRMPDEIAGEYADAVSVGNLVFGIVWIAFWSWLIAGLWARAPVAARLFMSLFPLVGLGAVYLALTVRTLAFDACGWRYRRAIFGRTLETEEGQWSEVSATRFWQMFRPPARSGAGCGLLEGDFAVSGPHGKDALNVKAQLWPPDDGVPSSLLHNTLGKRAICLAANDFDRFIRLVNRETPHLSYEWMNAFPYEDAPTPGGFLGLNSGPQRYVVASREGGPLQARG